MPDDGRFSLPIAGSEPSPSRGKLIFESKCTTCHQQNGKGVKKADGTYQFPPLWGWDSYNKSASLYKNDYLARFIWGNMPLGQDFSLTPQDAWDVAAFINIHERPKDPSKGIWSEIFGK
jgi:thiosulfate dehydrogenase